MRGWRGLTIAIVALLGAELGCNAQSARSALPSPQMISFGYVSAVAFSSDGHYLAMGTQNYTIAIIETTGWRIVRNLVGHTGPINSLAWNRDQILVSGSDDTTAIL